MLRFERRPRRLLLLDSDGARLYARSARAPEGLRELARFAPDTAGRQALSAWPEKTHAIALLVNLPEEGHFRETIPRLRGSEKTALMTRRLRQHFGDNPFIMASPLVSSGEAAGRRQEERLLLTALPRQILQDWLAALQPRPIAGIHGVPQVMADWLRHDARLPPVCLLLSLHGRALRQSLLQDGCVLFSRLSGAPEATEKSAWIAEETARLYAYLAHQQYVEPGAPLPVHLLAETPDAALDAAFAHPDMQPLALQALEWKTPPAAGFSGIDALLLARLATQPPRQHYAPAALRQQYLLPGRRRLLLGAGALFLLAGGYFGGMEMWAARKLRAESDAMRREAARQEEQAQSLLREKPELAIFPRIDEIRDARRLLEENARYRAERSPEAMLHALEQLAALLDQHPGLHLEKLHWQATEETLRLQGRALPADLARFLRHLARMKIAHANRQPTEDAPESTHANTDMAFDLALPLGTQP
ncbi:MAG: hypothetical protein LBC37_04605 [Zoogloeaceae bacterium]|jgi:hypothetical protein|nr:hypothetical protein [Zoogloeaceae bacterium]